MNALLIRLYDKIHKLIEEQRLKMLTFGKLGGGYAYRIK